MPSPISLADVARSYSPRVEALGEHLVLLDLEGLARLFGDTSAIGERLRRSAVEQGHAPVRIALESGSLLVMKGDTQRNWRHAIAKESRPCGPRVNLTFRRILD